MLWVVLIGAFLASLVAAIPRPAAGVRSPSRGASGVVRRRAAAVAAALALCGALVGAGPALGQSDSLSGPNDPSSDEIGQARVQAEATATVSGRVTDGSGGGIGDLSLDIRIIGTYWGGTRNFSVVTDADGAFMFGPVAEPVAGVNLVGGWVVEAVPADDRYASAHAVLSDTSAPLDIRLGPGGTVSGRVSGALDGVPLADAEIQLCYPLTCYYATSDDSGDFDFGRVAARTYQVRAYPWPYGDVMVSVVLEDGATERVELAAPPPSSEYEGRFYDDEGSVHEAAIDAVAWRGILAGTECGAAKICPGEGITRATMAVWLGRALSPGEPQSIDASRFADVDVDGRYSFEASHIERFADLGVTVGCRTEPLRYCPDRVVTRAEMATFLQRALSLDIPAEPAGFTDVDRESVHAGAIDALRAAGITQGCGTEPLRYCPDQPVLRGEMATFIHRSEERLTVQREAERFRDADVIGLDGARVSASLEAGKSRFYRFEVPDGGRSVVVETHGEADVTARLFRVASDAPDEELAFNDDGGSGANARIESVLRPGWYLVEVAGYGGTAVDYEISVAEDPRVQQERERFRDADVISLDGARVSASLGAGESHLYRFEVPDGGRPVVVDVYGQELVAVTLARVAAYARDEELGYYVNDLGNPLIARELQAGWYLIEVAGYLDGAADYEISVAERVQQQQQRFESAEVIGLGARVKASLELGEDHFYRFEVSDGEQFVVVETHGGETDVDAVLFRVVPDALDELIASNADGGSGYNARIGRVLQPGWYLIKVSKSFAYSGLWGDDYEISVTSA